jgi:hypothetical protein
MAAERLRRCHRVINPTSGRDASTIDVVAALCAGLLGGNLHNATFSVAGCRSINRRQRTVLPYFPQSPRQQHRGHSDWVPVTLNFADGSYHQAQGSQLRLHQQDRSDAA